MFCKKCGEELENYRCSCCGEDNSICNLNNYMDSPEMKKVFGEDNVISPCSLSSSEAIKAKKNNIENKESLSQETIANKLSSNNKSANDNIENSNKPKHNLLHILLLGSIILNALLFLKVISYKNNLAKLRKSLSVNNVVDEQLETANDESSTTMNNNIYIQDTITTTVIGIESTSLDSSTKSNDNLQRLIEIASKCNSFLDENKPSEEEINEILHCTNRKSIYVLNDFDFDLCERSDYWKERKKCGILHDCDNATEDKFMYYFYSDITSGKQFAISTQHDVYNEEMVYLEKYNNLSSSYFMVTYIDNKYALYILKDNKAYPCK